MRQRLFIFCLGILFFSLIPADNIFAVHKTGIEGLVCGGAEVGSLAFEPLTNFKLILTVPCSLQEKITQDYNQYIEKVQSENRRFGIYDFGALQTVLESSLKGSCFGGIIKQKIGPTADGSFMVAEKEVPDCEPLARVMSFNVSATQVEENGSYTISWSAKSPPAEQCDALVMGRLSQLLPESERTRKESFSGLGDSKTLTLLPKGKYTNTFTCNGILDASKSGKTGNVILEKEVIVGNIPPDPTVKLIVEPAVIEKGESAVLSWTSTDAVSLSVDQKIGIVAAPSGAKNVTPGVSTPYTITATGEFASAKSSITLSVVEPSPPIVIFKAEPTRIKKGEKIKLIWTTEKAKSVTIRERVGVVDLGGTRDLPLSGEIELIPRGEGEIFYTLEAVGKSPDLITVKTIPVHVIISQGPIVTLVAEPTRIKKGESVKLKWQTTNAKSVLIEGIGGKEPVDSGFVLVRPEVTTEYKIIAEGLYSELGKAEATARVEVISGQEPSVSISVQPDTIKPGEKATLRWDSSNAKSLRIEPTVGLVKPEGSIQVSPRVTTTYIITAAGTDPLFRPTRSSVTVKVASPDGKPVELLLEVPPEEPIIQAPEAPEPLKVDLKINGQDQDLTMEAPASFTLSWNLNKYCLAYGSWIGIKTKAEEERHIERKSGLHTYKLYCPGIGSDAVTVKVVGKENVGTTGKGATGRGVIGIPAVPMPIAEASISLDGKNFSRSVRVIRGKPVKLWLSAAYDVDGDRRASRDDSGSWTSAFSLGGRCEWNSDLNQGTPTFESATFDPQNKEECAIPLGESTFFDKPGTYRYGVLQLVQNDGKVSGIGYINVAVQEPPPPDTPPVVDLRINDSDKEQIAIGAPAEYVVSWDVRNADTCKASGSWAGDKFLTGAERFVASFKKELAYTLTCVGKLGTTEKTILLKVAELPVCEFSALPAVLDKQSVFDRQSMLSWKCKFANSCYISPPTGASNAVFGSIRVRPTATTNYTLTCENLDGSSSFGTAVEVR